MTKSFKIQFIFIASAVFIIGGFYYLLSNKFYPKQIENIQPTPTESVPNSEITPESTSTSTPMPANNQPVNTTTIIPNGPPQGTITCSYQIPVGPTTYGTADVNSTWTNLTTGKNGSAQAAVCVEVNGTTTLMSLDNSINGSRDTSVPWLAPNVKYTFNLYDDRGGDAANCTGTVLSSCGVTTMLPATPTP